MYRETKILVAYIYNAKYAMVIKLGDFNHYPKAYQYGKIRSPALLKILGWNYDYILLHVHVYCNMKFINVQILQQNELLTIFACMLSYWLIYVVNIKCKIQLHGLE